MKSTPPIKINLKIALFSAAGGFQDLVGGRNYRRLEEEVWQVSHKSACFQPDFENFFLTKGNEQRDIDVFFIQSEPNLGDELRRPQPQDGFSREKKVFSQIG